ncbi:MAG: DUF1592 domain-containing protein [Candidatus Sulfopaludibacter sp.]|nr:DUF1592 domain-containing protein [Candidatus Sulfopaludibacter sp.]
MISLIPAVHAAAPDLDRQFAQTVRPTLAKYCIGCHSGSSPAAQLDLKSYSSLDAVIRDFARWGQVMDKLTAKQMPPAIAPQPPDATRQEVIDWIKAVRTGEARKTAGDPGVVLARRLSNAEYNYTIRDLTGVDIQPTREFPVDPDNPAGFDNSGESLTMSPALLKKYLQAARDVSDHMVLTPDGFSFAAYPMLVETDRDKYAIQRIVNFYKSQPTNFTDYFEAAWRYKYRVALGKPHATLLSTALDAKVSPKYLAMVWPMLEESPEAAKAEVGPIATLQTLWRYLPAPGADTLDVLRAQCDDMAAFVIRIRKETGMQFAAPKVRGLPAGSQALLDWKNLQYSLHRRDFDRASLRNDTGPPPVVPVIPRYPGLHQEGAPHWAALIARSRAADPDLAVPAAARSRYEAAFARFAHVFPDGFYVQERGRYFPDDSQDKGRLLSAGYHNVMGYTRDDEALQELILDEKGVAQLNRLWDEFDFIAAHTARTWDQYYFNQSGEVDGKGAEAGRLRPADKPVNDSSVIFGLRDDYLAKAAANPDNDRIAPEAIRNHFQRIDDTLRRMEKMHADAEPLHLEALLKFAARAYRRPLTRAERDDLLAYYHTIREKEGLSHEDAIRDCIVSVLMSPDFCYRIDLLDARTPQTGIVKTAGTMAVRPLSGYALASRLSYFLWSSMPDQELLAHAAAGDLQKPEVLLAEVHRLMKDPKAAGFATEFGGNWLEFRHFDQINTVDRERFPSFTPELRDAMFQEPIRLIEDAVHNNRSVLDLLYGNYTFVNPVLAKHYGMNAVQGDNDTWVRVDNAAQYQRGGLLPMAVFLTENSPGLRTSPVKRGHWVVKDVLGEVIPPPPPVVPELPHDEAKTELSVRELLAQHRANPVCASCHARFDDYGLAFENYGPVGDARAKDLGGRTVDTKVSFPGGFTGDGFQAILDYVRDHRQNEYLDNLSRKLLAYALNRSLQLSDDLTIERMDSRLAAGGYRFSELVDTIVASPQFLNQRSPEALLRKGE